MTSSPGNDVIPDSIGDLPGGTVIPDLIGDLSGGTVIPDLIGDLKKECDMEEFEYAKAIEELEAIAAKVEDPQTGIGDIDRYIKRSEELIEACRAYLRGARERLDGIS